jgi:hypothetical protein
MVKGDPTRRRSNNEHAPNNAALQGILAVSDTLTYKQVRRFFLSLFVYGVFCILFLWGVLHFVCSVADPNFFHPGSPDPNFFHPGSRIRIKEFNCFNRKNGF